MLEIKSINKSFNSIKVLNNISFGVTKGRTFGIIGPNGAGKTTTLRILLGITSPTSGNVFLESKPLDQKYHDITGYLPEERGLYPKSNVQNTLIYLAQLKGLKYSQALSQVKYWLERLNLYEYKRHHIEELSKGNQQKVQFITAILHDPKILVLDEPFSGFDPVNQSTFKDIIEEMKPDKYVIISTHLMDLAESLCDDIFMIDSGKEILSGDLKAILQSKVSNDYEVVFRDNISDKLDSYLSEYKFRKLNEFRINVELEADKVNAFINKFSELSEISEFKKISPSLHQLFISNVNKQEA